jgi:hypothetical protein
MMRPAFWGLCCLLLIAGRAAADRADVIAYLRRSAR